MKRRTHLADKSALVTLDECRRMAYADFSASGQQVVYHPVTGKPIIDPEKYFLANQAAYYVLANTWILMIAEFCPKNHLWMEISYTCQVHGLFYGIETASNLSDSFVAILSSDQKVTSAEDALRGVQLGEDIDLAEKAVWLGVCQAILGDNWYLHVPDLLQILRYPKRFSPLKLDYLKENCIKDFLNVMNYDRNRSLREGSYYLDLQMRDIIDQFLPHANEIIQSMLHGKSCTFRSNQDGKWYTFNPEDYFGSFSPGAVAECQADELAKLVVLAQTAGTYRGCPFPADVLPHDSRFMTERMPWDPQNPLLMDMRPTYAEFYPVPKNFKKARGIAAEQLYRQEASKGFSELLYDIFSRLSYFGERYTRDDQTGQQELVGLGSELGNFGSIDLTSASDTNLWTQVQTWFPSEVVRVYRALRSDKVLMPNGKLVTTQMAFTSGHTLTFFTESMIFGAVLELASSFARNFEYSEKTCFNFEDRPVQFYTERPPYGPHWSDWGEVETITFYDKKGGYQKDFDEFYSWHSKKLTPKPHAKLPDWGVYGDDCAIRDDAWYLAIQLLENFGFIVNTQKSFLGKYTEACGREYYEGREISSHYWPRKSLLGLRDELSPNSILSIIDLQHRLFSYKEASLFLSWYVRDFLPDITVSWPGTECTDLWGNTPRELQFTYSFEERNGKLVKVNVDPSYKGHYVAVVKTKSRAKEGSGKYSCRINGVVTEVDPALAKSLLSFKSYVDFLIDGPVYSTELDRLLGVSVRRDRYKALKVESLDFQPNFKA